MLLEIEYNHEKEEFRKQTETMGVERKIRRGDAWFPVTIGNCYYNSLNQAVVEVTRTKDSDIEHNFEPGRPVCFFTVRRDEKTHRERIQYMSFTATVSYADHDRIVVALPNSGRIADLQRSEAIGLQLFFDETSYRLMFDALDRVISAKTGRLAALRDIENGRLHKCFIEMSACIGSCVGGPVMEKYHRTPISDYVSVAEYAGTRDFPVRQPESDCLRKHFEPIERRNGTPSEEEIAQILRKMGKTKPEDELNCGSCGYDTCREKAIAIYHGKAEISMCLPYLKEKAESFSDCIVNNTPNGLIVVNDALEVQQINAAARKIMNIRSASDVLGDQVVRILDPAIFLKVLETKRSIRDQRVYLAEYKKYVEQTVVYDSNYQMLVCIMRDVTDEETEREKKEDISRRTVEIADKVVDKQMRIVQEIASLLGETAAETKIALTKLKESISDE